MRHFVQHLKYISLLSALSVAISSAASAFGPEMPATSPVNPLPWMQSIAFTATPESVAFLAPVPPSIGFTAFPPVFLTQQLAHATLLKTAATGGSEFSAPVQEAELSGSRGAFSPSLLSVTGLSAYSADNMVTGGVTGNNFINGNSFTGTQGLVNVIQNSGNNVLIQSATNVNVVIRP